MYVYTVYMIQKERTFLVSLRILVLNSRMVSSSPLGAIRGTPGASPPSSAVALWSAW